MNYAQVTVLAACVSVSLKSSAINRLAEKNRVPSRIPHFRYWVTAASFSNICQNRMTITWQVPRTELSFDTLFCTVNPLAFALNKQSAESNSIWGNVSARVYRRKKPPPRLAHMFSVVEIRCRRAADAGRQVRSCSPDSLIRFHRLPASPRCKAAREDPSDAAKNELLTVPVNLNTPHLRSEGGMRHIFRPRVAAHCSTGRPQPLAYSHTVSIINSATLKDHVCAN